MNESDAGRTLLVADIGATNARFATVQETVPGILPGEPVGKPVGEPVGKPVGKPVNDPFREVVVLPAVGYRDGHELLRDVRSRLQQQEFCGCCIALASPVHNGQGSMSNGELTLNEDALASELGCRTMLVNDFYAVARSLPLLQRLRKIGGHAGRPGPRAVIGPGSGLGMGLVVPRDNETLVLPSEGGHADLAPGNPLETEIIQILQRAGHPTCWESVLSGPGLVTLYGTVREIWGGAPYAEEDLTELTPEWVTANGVSAQDPICHQTLEIFFGLLGAAAGNLALTFCAHGGVYVGGGIVPQMVDFAEASAFRRRFEDRGRLQSLVAQIPLYIVLDSHPGLLGALECWRLHSAEML